MNIFDPKINGLKRPCLRATRQWPGLYEATSASFFNRASLFWLKQLQDRLPPSNTRTHQDLNKIVMALEYSADATLNPARFMAKSIGSTIASRRLLWLRHWQADARSKWQLASSPYSADALFGPPLEPLLIETRDKRKILPSVSRQSDYHYTSYAQPQSFGPLTLASTSLTTSSRSNPDHNNRTLRSDKGANSNRNIPFRGAGAGLSIGPNNFSSGAP